MKNDDIKRIPATRVTIAPTVRNTTVVRISSQRNNTPERKRPAPAAGGFEEAQERRPKESDFIEPQSSRPESNGDIWKAMDSRPITSDDFAGTAKKRPKKSDGFLSDNREEISKRPKKQNGFFEAEDDGFDQSIESEFSERRSNYSGSYRRAGNVRPDTDTPFVSFIVEVLFTALLLSAVCALLTIRLGGESPLSFSYPGNSLWAYMCISVAAFALLRMFFRVPYFTGVFAAFGTLFAVNLSWLTGLARLFLGENAASAGGFALYLILLAGFLMLLWLMYKKRFRLDLAVKVLGGVLAVLVLVNLGINWPM